MGAALARLVSRPFLDLVRGQARCLGRLADLVWMLAGLLAGWWIYVPLHELLHAAGCLLAGGSVSRLEIAPHYGGGFLARVFPWVEAGGDYAGRLAGFDTGGSDWVYLATDLAPYVLVLFPGVWALRLAARRGAAFAFGLLLPFAFAPFLSLTGDAYEIGSLAAAQMPAWEGGAARALLVGDDLALRAAALGAAGASSSLWTGFAFAALVGVLWAFATYGLGSLAASALGQRPLLAPVARDEDAEPDDETGARLRAYR
jgi:hypothetical protein